MSGLASRLRLSQHRLHVTIAAAAACCAAPQAASAQLLSNFGASIQARAEYDSNVAREAKTQAALSGTRPDDIRYTISGSVNTKVPIGRQDIALTGDIGYNFYQYNKDLRRAHADIKASTGRRIGPCPVGVRASYLRSLAESVPLATTDRRNSDQEVISYGGSVSCPLIGPIGATLNVERRELTSDGANSVVGTRSIHASSTIGYQSRTFGNIGLVGSYTATRHDRPASITSVLALPTGSKVYSLGLQYSRPITFRLSGSAAVSQVWFRSDDPLSTQLLTGGDTSGLSWNVGLAYTASDRLGLTASYSDSTGSTSRAGSASQRAKIGSLRLNYKFSRRMDGTLGLSVADRSFSGRQSLPGQASTQRRSTYSGSLSYNLRRNIDLGLNAAHETVHTDLNTLDYTADRIGVFVGAHF